MKEYTIFIYGSCHISEYLENDLQLGNGGYGMVICLNDKTIKEI